MEAFARSAIKYISIDLVLRIILWKVMRGYKERKDLEKTAGRAIPWQK